MKLKKILNFIFFKFNILIIIKLIFYFLIMSFLLLANQKEIYEKLKINENDDFNIQIKKLLENKNLFSLLLLNKLLEKYNFFDNQICVKYYNFLIDFFKLEINKNNFIENQKNLFFINSSLSKFLLKFYKNFQNFEENHKNIKKNLHNFIQLFFKFLKNNFELIYKFSIENNNLKFLESFFILIITFNNYFPTMIRPFQKEIENYLIKIFNYFILNNNFQLFQIKTFIISFSILFKLSPQSNNKFQENINNLLNNILFYFDYFRSKTVDEENNKFLNKNIQNLNKIFDIQKINNSNLKISIKIFEFFFNLFEMYFISLNSNELINVNFNEIFQTFFNILNNFNNKNKKKQISIVLNGLSNNNFIILKKEIFILILKSLNFIFENYSFYILNYFSIISQIFNILLNQELTNYFEIFSNSLILFTNFIKIFQIYLPSTIDQIIFNFSFNNFPIFYFDFLEKNDKTIIQIEKSYYLIKNIKNNFSDSKENFSEKENEKILILFFDLFNVYFQSNFESNFNNQREILSNLIDLIILPNYAKFIFYLDFEIKNKILILIENSVRFNKCDFNREKLFKFLKNFYSRDSLFLNRIQIIFNILNLNENEFSIQNSHDLTNKIIDFNMKIKELISNKENYLKEKFLNNKRENLNEIENIEINKKQKINESENQINIKNKEENEEFKITKIEKNENENFIIDNQKENKEKNENNENKEKNENNDNKEDNNLNSEDDIEIPDII